MSSPKPVSSPKVPYVYAGHEKELGGGFIVRRLLPGHPQRYVGPFVFFDHFGPTDIDAGQNIDVRPHPHIGLATVTYLFEGEMMHRDSLGSVQRIRPGDINWMTAGRGIVHSERTTDENRGKAWRSHGLQLWVALPREAEECPPAFHHHAADSLPCWQEDAVRLRLMAGSSCGRQSPVEVSSPMIYMDLRWEQDGHWTVPEEHAERALYVIAGQVNVDGKPVTPRHLALLAPGEEVRVEASLGTRAVLVGGAPLDGPRYIWWNFVSSSKERLEQAKADWAEERFGSIPDDDKERIPLPQR
ncbi:pirin family protein [Azoarcus sp. TTM-91]|uniref:pirin family protein n=1 Tax=Azoarcus sp. TTM-91 TaxID=2691581 RepID=UPI00145E9040|nr:pirin family protein [Azoarcus sp. TTM-91]NMG37407.1 pirin family protein [Azoarcus sp. TTM-91]